MIRGLDGLNRRLNAISGNAFGSGITRDLGLATVRNAKRLVPRKTGNLGRSIRIGSVTPETVTVVASANYAGFVEKGTRPHVIRPRNAKVLRFATGSNRRLSGRPRSKGQVIFAREVHHPGTKAQPFLLPGARQAVSEAGLTSSLIKRWNDAA